MTSTNNRRFSIFRRPTLASFGFVPQHIGYWHSRIDKWRCQCYCACSSWPRPTNWGPVFDLSEGLERLSWTGKQVTWHRNFNLTSFKIKHGLPDVINTSTLVSIVISALPDIRVKIRILLIVFYCRRNQAFKRHRRQETSGMIANPSLAIHLNAVHLFIAWTCTCNCIQDPRRCHCNGNS